MNLENPCEKCILKMMCIVCCDNLNDYFTKQLDYVVDKHESQKFLKYLDLLKSIEKKEVP